MSKTDYADGKYIRAEGSVSFQERSVQPFDFTRSRGYEYAERWALYGDNFWQKYPFWQIFADCFIMRRSVVRITGKQRCATKSFHSGDLNGYLEVGFQQVKSFRMPGLDRSSIPKGKYQLESFRFSDAGNGFTDCVVAYVQNGDWEMVQLQDTTVDPATGRGVG